MLMLLLLILSSHKHKVWDKLKEEQATHQFRPDDEMEFEDAQGNVFSKKTYELLQKQGLIWERQREREKRERETERMATNIGERTHSKKKTESVLAWNDN